MHLENAKEQNKCGFSVSQKCCIYLEVLSSDMDSATHAGAWLDHVSEIKHMLWSQTLRSLGYSRTSKLEYLHVTQRFTSSHWAWDPPSFAREPAYLWSLLPFQRAALRALTGVRQSDRCAERKGN